jgi:hypothetical protein
MADRALRRTLKRVGSWASWTDGRRARRFPRRLLFCLCFTPLALLLAAITPRGASILKPVVQAQASCTEASRCDAGSCAGFTCNNRCGYWSCTPPYGSSQAINCGPCAAPTPTPTPEPSGPSCGDLGGDFCSQSASCPGGYASLGGTYDCKRCCKQQPTPTPTPAGPSCGDLGGNYCSQSASCPAGYASLGGTYDCHPCCKQQPTPTPTPVPTPTPPPRCGDGSCTEHCSICPQDCGECDTRGGYLGLCRDVQTSCDGRCGNWTCQADPPGPIVTIPCPACPCTPPTCAQGTCGTLPSCGGSVVQCGDCADADAACVNNRCAPIVIVPTGYTCSAMLKDEYGRPVADKNVHLVAYSDAEGVAVVASQILQTLPDGTQELSISPQGEVRRVECRVYSDEVGTLVEPDRYVLQAPPAGEGAPLSDGQSLSLNAVAVPAPTFTKAIAGAQSKSHALAALYQSGAYDKVVVLAEMFNSNEQFWGPRGRDGLWREVRSFARLLYAHGFDVWLVSTITGQNIHEQAAEFAQAIQLAAVEYPQSHAGEVGNYNGRVSVLGVSLGGVVARVATARWQADDAWRTALGLQAELPVHLVYFIDSPLLGAQVNYDLQAFIHDPAPLVGSYDHKQNINSCAFQQLVRSSRLATPGAPGPSDPASRSNSTAFFDTGEDVEFYGPGVCDVTASAGSRGSTTLCRCLSGGVAVNHINANGFARAPYLRTIAYSDGTRNQRNQCYGGEKDLTRDGKNVCPDAPVIPYMPAVGSVGIKAIGDHLSDREMVYLGADLESGSRQTLDMTARTEDSFAFFGYTYEQYASGTFIPTASAFGSSSPSGCAVDVCIAREDFNATHVNLTAASFGAVCDELQKASGSRDKCVVPNAATSADAPLDASAPVSQPSLPNAAPVAVVHGPLVAAVGQAITLTGEATDPDGRLARAFWNLGDGTYGDGTSVSHVYQQPGTYQVVFAATDDRGATTAVETTVSVETPGPTALLGPADGEYVWSSRIWTEDGVGLSLAPIGASGATVTLSWAAVAGATEYELYVVDGSRSVVHNGTLAAAGICSGATCGFPLSNLAGGATYRWMVRGLNAQGAGPATPSRSFIVATTRPPQNDELPVEINPPVNPEM